MKDADCESTQLECRLESNGVFPVRTTRSAASYYCHLLYCVWSSIGQDYLQFIRPSFRQATNIDLELLTLVVAATNVAV